ncbi:hypothetical protein SAMN02910456_00387 [Ruminococcaceae bacterium YRB3002]|nr:hypothetical protein SAMN02910456_00387 [Ruminococcaceae bacterium YRB3002]
MFNVNYYIGTINYCSEELKKLPHIYHGSHGNDRIIRLYDSKTKKRREFYESSRYWKQATELASRRAYLEERIKILKDELLSNWNVKYDKHASNYRTVPEIKHRLDSSFWNGLTDEAPSFPKNNNYLYKGIYFRSRVEVNIAKVLDRLGLKYRYDVKVTMNGHKYFADFVVYLPQFNCCFLIEFFGRLDDYGYRRDNAFKTFDYFSEGIYLGENLIILCGKENNMPSFEVIAEQITALVNSIASQSTVSVL